MNPFARTISLASPLDQNHERSSAGCPFHAFRRAFTAEDAPRVAPVEHHLGERELGVPRASLAPLVAGLPLLGPSLDLLRDPYGWWPHQLRKHGPVFRMRLPTDRCTWIALAGRAANELLATEGRRLFSQALTYPKAEQVLQTPLHPSITEGDLQRHLRRQIAPGFARQTAEPHLRQVVQVTRATVNELAAGQSFNVTRWTSRLGLDAISVVATGEPVGHDPDRYRQYATLFTGVIAMGWPLALMRWPSVRRTREGLDTLIAERFAEHARRPPSAGGRPADTFDCLLRGTLPDGSPLPERVRVVFGQMAFKNMGVYAGRVLNHVLYELVRRPELLARVLPEINRVLGGEAPSLDELDSMVTFRAAIRETLRVRPIAVAVQRTVIEPFSFGGYRFVPGDKLFFPISATHSLAEHFQHPDRFDVDRFLGNAPEPERYTYNPFGLGHHGCVARGLFEVLTLITVGIMLQRWRLEAPYTLRTIVDALPGPWPGHRMHVVGERSELS